MDGRISRPSAFTQWVYGVSFSVLNLLARSSETTAFLAIWLSISTRSSAHDPIGRPTSVDHALSRRLGRPGFGDCHAFFRPHAYVNTVASRRAQGGMNPGKQDSFSYFDLEIQVIAEKHLGIHDAVVEVVVFLAHGGVFEKLDILGPHRHDHRSALREGFNAVHVELTDGRRHPAAAVAGRAREHLPVDEIRVADEIGDELVARPFVNIARRTDLDDTSLVHDGDLVRKRQRLA